MLMYSSTFRSLRSGRTRSAGARDDFFTSSEPKETPLPQRRLAAGSLAPPTPGGSRRNSPWRARHRRDNSRRPRAALALQKGGCCRLGFRHCRRAVVPSFRHGIRHDSSPGAGRGPGLSTLPFGFGCFRLAVIGRVSPRRARVTFLWRRESHQKRPAAAPASPVPSLHPRPAGRVETRPAGSDIDATIPAGHGLLSAPQKGKATAGSASPLPAGCGAFV